MSWWAHVALDGVQPDSLYVTNVLFPTPHPLAFSDLQLGVAPWFTVIYALTREPVLSYQLTMLVGAIGCAFGFFVLLRSWTGSTLGGVAAGVAALVAPYRESSAALLYLHFIPYIPLALLCIDRIALRQRTLLAMLGLFVAVLLQSASSGYLAFTMFAVVGIHALVALWQHASSRATTAACLLGAVVPAAALLALLYGPVATQLASVVHGAEASEHYVNPWMRLFWKYPWWNLKSAFLGGAGGPLLVLAALGFFVAAGRYRATAPLVVGAGVVLTLGPSVEIGSMQISHLPWEWLASVVPGFGLQRHPYFTKTLVGVGITLLVGWGIAWMTSRPQRSRAWWVILVGIVLWSFVAYRAPLSSHKVVRVAPRAAIPEAYRWLAEHGAGEPLLELPVGMPSDAIYQYFSVYHWLPLFNGTASYLPPGYAGLAKTANRVLSDDLAAQRFLDSVPVTRVLVHVDLLPEDRAARLVTGAPPHLRLEARFGPDLIFRVHRQGIGDASDFRLHKRREPSDRLGDHSAPVMQRARRHVRSAGAASYRAP